MLKATLPPWIVLDSHLIQWLQEDIGRGDRSTQGLANVVGGASRSESRIATATWIAKETGIVAALPVAKRVFELLSPEANFQPLIAEGAACESGQSIAEITADLATLLMGERTALNLAMRLSGIATATHEYVECIADLPTQLVDTRKTTPGLRLLEKYATTVGGGVNHRIGLDDAVMIKDNHIVAAGGIRLAIESIRLSMPYPLTIEVETESLEQVREAIDCRADIIMLDNMHPDLMRQAVGMIRAANERIKIEASGNITLKTIRQVAETGVDYISTSAPITRSPWLDLSMRIIQ
ncbi:carboxylating nicotinate-nucleotide diphosphorylase [Chamaesiphon sp. VAR_48_metabat_135_sub]|uniref:carboxylating nicotinate-nucleotide diphosphorylase n=1 Tax=Chamaesiphon sp. VAR_48_metabat_135_sub TaxID=2964699 RepID=UPI00286C0185|nr:carboxylating nicotinate-nucleotide diphosphorylase [Chamaesiphon sp. VAR_48_metabat_135_sub]